MSDTFSGCEIVEIGINIEKNGRDFYGALAQKSTAPEIVETFEYLKEAETEHERVLEELFSQTCEYNPKEAYPEEYFSYMKALSGQYVFTEKGAGGKLAEKIKNNEEALDAAIQLEKDSVLFYEEMKKVVPEKDRSIVDKIISEEKKHVVKLCELKGGCCDEECKGL